MKTVHVTLSRQTSAALQLLGQLIKAARKERDLSQADLAGRLGVSRHTVMSIEKGDPKVAVGAVLEAATILGVPLLAEDAAGLARLSSAVTGLATVLPQRAGRKKTVLDDDF